jgi:hypothetical protein
MLPAAGVPATKATDVNDEANLVEAFSAAFHDTFGARALEVAESQRDQADVIIRQRWQQVIDRLIAIIPPQA